MEAVKSFKWMTAICPRPCGLMALPTNSPHPATGGGHVPHWVPAASESRLLKAALLHYKSFQSCEVAKWFPKSPSDLFFSVVACEVSQSKKYILLISEGFFYKHQHRQTLEPGEKINFWRPISIPHCCQRCVVFHGCKEGSELNVRKLRCTMKKLLMLIENI